MSGLEKLKAAASAALVTLEEYSSHLKSGSIPKCFRKKVKEAMVMVHEMVRIGRKSFFISR